MKTLNDILQTKRPTGAVKKKSFNDIINPQLKFEPISQYDIPALDIPEIADPKDVGAIVRSQKRPIGFVESVKEEFDRPAKGAQYVPMVGGIIGTAENILYLAAADRLSKDYDYSKPIHPERLAPGAQGIIPPSFTSKDKDIKLIEDLLVRTQNQQERGYSFGGKVAKGVMVLPTWMVEFALTGGLAKLGSNAAQEAGEKLLRGYAKTKAGQLALKTAGWTGGAITRTTLGLAPRVAEEATRRRVDIQLLGADPESWATSIAKGWGNVFIESASEEAGGAITKGLTKGISKMPFGNKFLTALRRAWTGISPDNTTMMFWQNIFTKAGYSNIIGEIGEERLATIMHAIANTEDFGAGKDSNVLDRLKAGISEDIKNFPVEATVLSVPGATKYAAKQVTGTPTFEFEPTKEEQQQFKKDVTKMEVEQEEHQLSLKDQHRQAVRKAALEKLSMEELEEKLINTSLTSPFFKEIYGVWNARKEAQEAEKPEIPATRAIPEPEQPPAGFFEQERVEMPPAPVQKPTGVKKTIQDVVSEETAPEKIISEEEPPKPKSVDELVEKGRQAKADWIAKQKAPAIEGEAKKTTILDADTIVQKIDNKNLSEEQATSFIRSRLSDASSGKVSGKDIFAVGAIADSENLSDLTRKIAKAASNQMSRIQAGKELLTPEKLAAVSGIDIKQIQNFLEGGQKSQEALKQAPAIEAEKQLWEMTGDEYAIEGQRLIDKGLIEPEDVSQAAHRIIVKDAVEENKPVPRGVLEEYKSEPWAQQALQQPKAEEKEEKPQFLEVAPRQTDLLGRPLTRGGAAGPQKDFGFDIKKAPKKEIEVKIDLERAVTKALNEDAQKAQDVKSYKGVKTAKQLYENYGFEQREDLFNDPMRPHIEFEQAFKNATEGRRLEQTRKKDIEEKEKFEEKTGLSDKRRGQLIKQIETYFKKDPQYRDLIEDERQQAERALQGFGAIYIDPKSWTEVEDIIGKRKGAPTKLQSYFTKDPQAKNNQHWDEVKEYIQNELNHPEAENWKIEDVVYWIKDALEVKKTGISWEKLGVLANSRPDIELMLNLHEGITIGESADQLNEKVDEWADYYDVPQSERQEYYIGPETKKLWQIKQIKDPKKKKEEIEKYAREKVVKRNRRKAVEAVNEVLKANEIDIPVEEVKEIKKPVQKPKKPPSPKKAARFRGMAETIEKQIEDKRREMTQNPTPKRMREYYSRIHDAENLERLQKALRVMADGLESGTLPTELEGLTKKADIQSLVYKGLLPGGYYEVNVDPEYRNKSTKAKILQDMIEAAETPEDSEKKAERERFKEIKKAEEKFRFLKIKGFFPTPAPVISVMLDKADIEPGMNVLEPSAGKGDIADRIMEVGVKLDVIELRPGLQEILRLKGHNLVGEDFLEKKVDKKYDRIVMNPPFEKGQDQQHVQHAFDFLKPGGRLVAIMSEGSFTRSRKADKAFQEWFDNVGGESEKLTSGSFKGKESFSQTGVSSRIVTIDKDGIPFDRRQGRPVGAAILTPAGREIVLLAYGADSATGYHEAYHVLRRRLRDKDIKLLDYYYKGDEEAEAVAFAKFVKTGRARQTLKGMWQRLKNILIKIKNALQGLGYRTAEDIFSAIQTGTIKKKAPSGKGVRFAYKGPSYNEIIKKQRELEEVVAAVKEPETGQVYDGDTHYEAIRNMLSDPVKGDFPTKREVEAAENNYYMNYPEYMGFVDKNGKFVTRREAERRWNVQTIEDIWNVQVGDVKFAMGEYVDPDELADEIEKTKKKVEGSKKPQIKRFKINIRDTTPLLKKTPEWQEWSPAGPARESNVPIPKQDVTKTPPLSTELYPDTVLDELVAEPKGKPAQKLYFSEKWYQEQIKDQKAKLRHVLRDKTKKLAQETYKFLDLLFGASSTRLYNINPELFRSVRRYAYDMLTRTTSQVAEVEPFLHKMKRIPKDDYKRLDLAFKNSDAREIKRVVNKYKLNKDYGVVRDVLNDIYNAAKLVGIEMEYKSDYWHRAIKDPKGFLEYFQGTQYWSIIQQALQRRAERAGRTIIDLTPEEKAHVVNTLLRGFRTQALTLSAPGAAKERTVDVVFRDINQFYHDSRDALIMYIKEMNAKITEREFFGKETTEITKLRQLQSARLTRLMKLKRRIGLKKGTTEGQYKTHISEAAENFKADQERLQRLTNRSPVDSIGGYVMELQAGGLIRPDQEKELQDILRGIFYPKKMGRSMGIFSTSIYLDTIGSPLQALTQLDEYAYAAVKSASKSIPVAVRAIVRRSKITPRDIGITSIGTEFQSASLQKALSVTLKLTGFEEIDRINKEIFINTALAKMQAQAKRNSWHLKRDLQRVFGKDYKKVMFELRKPIKSLEDISDNIKFMLFNELLDIQPVAITEMSQAYNRAGWARILYTLKTFYIKRLDYVRNDCLKLMKHKETFIEGFGRLVWLATTFALLGAGSDFLKDFIKGRAFDLYDSVVDNLLRMVMSSKFQVTKAKKEGAGRAVLEQIIPPTKAIDAATKDWITIAEGKDRGFELWRSVPIGGELYYWWFGAGADKNRGNIKGSGSE